MIYSRNIKAKRRNAKKPIISVTVVKIILDDWAGSAPSFFITMGMAAPAKPAAIRFTIIPKPTTIPKNGLACHNQAITAVIRPIITPLTPIFMETRHPKQF
jgi:hypothetical protein